MEITSNCDPEPLTPTSKKKNADSVYDINFVSMEPPVVATDFAIKYVPNAPISKINNPDLVDDVGSDSSHDSAISETANVDSVDDVHSDSVEPSDIYVAVEIASISEPQPVTPTSKRHNDYDTELSTIKINKKVKKVIKLEKAN